MSYIHHPDIERPFANSLNFSSFHIFLDNSSKLKLLIHTNQQRHQRNIELILELFQAAHEEQLFTLGPKRLQFANQSSVSCLPKQWQQV